MEGKVMQTVVVKGRVFNYSHAMGRGSDGGIGFKHTSNKKNWDDPGI